MSRKGDFSNNAVIKSFFGALKHELVSFYHYATRAEARQAISEYIFSIALSCYETVDGESYISMFPSTPPRVGRRSRSSKRST